MEGICAQKDGRKSDNDEPAGTFFLGRRFRTTTGTAWAHETTENSENALWTKNEINVRIVRILFWWELNGQIVLCFKWNNWTKSKIANIANLYIFVLMCDDAARHGTALRGAEPCLAASSPVNTKVLQMKNSHIFGAKIQIGLHEMTLIIFKHCFRTFFFLQRLKGEKPKGKVLDKW